MLFILKICLLSVYLFWHKEGPQLLFYGLILFSIFFFFVSSTCLCKVWSSLHSQFIRFLNFIQRLCSNSTPSSRIALRLVQRRKQDEGSDLKFYIPGTCFQPQNHRRVSSCSFVNSKRSIQKLRTLMLKFSSLHRLTTPLLQCFLFSCEDHQGFFVFMLMR